MGKVFDGIDEVLASWIRAQPVWFVATAPLAADGHVNVSPRGPASLSILGPRQVGWVDHTGSGVETIAHRRENGRICLMFASFDRRPRIVRLHGRGTVALPGERGAVPRRPGACCSPTPHPSCSSSATTMHSGPSSWSPAVVTPSGRWVSATPAVARRMSLAHR
ncbi:MAG: pyridoxamine 5'-phosphate oxidase family protein [Nocardioidaceae bacterium]